MRLAACNSSHTGQHWFFNAAATTTQAPVSVGLHIKLESGLCLAAKANVTRSCLELQSCRDDPAQALEKESEAQSLFLLGLRTLFVIAIVVLNCSIISIIVLLLSLLCIYLCMIIIVYYYSRMSCVMKSIGVVL